MNLLSRYLKTSLSNPTIRAGVIPFILAGFIFFTLTAVAGAAVDINNVAVSAIKTDSVVIGWDSTAAGTSQIEYGTSIFYGNTTAEESLSYFHTTELSGLAEGTLYHYRIRSKEYSGIETVSADYTFTTRTQAELEAVIKAARADGGLPKTYYVKTDGNNANDGLTIATAWQTPSYAVSKVDAGDTIYLLDGTYNDPNTMNFTTAHDGIDVAPVTLTAYSGKPIIDGGNSSNYGLYIDGSSWYGAGNIVISGITIRNYIKIFDIRYTQNITLDGLEIYGSNIPQAYGLGLIAASRNITVNNCDFHDPVGYNSLEIIGQRLDGYTGQDSSNIQITNSRFYNNSKHASLQIDEFTYNIIISENKFWNNTIAGGCLSLYIHNLGARPPKYFIIRNNIMENSTASLQPNEGSNGLVENITITNPIGYGMEFKKTPGDAYALENVIFRDITITNQKEFIYLAGGRNLLFERTNLINSSYAYDWRIQDSDGGNIVIRDEVEPEYTIVLVNTANVVIEYTNNKVFKYTQLSGTANTTVLPAFYPDKSFFSQERNGSGNSLFNIQTYPFTARPASGSATVTVTKFNTTLDKGSVLVDFAADTANGNNIDFIIADLKADTNYQVTRAGVNYHVVQSNSNKCIAFSNSEWSTKTFTITETAAIADIITPPEVNLGSTQTNPIDINQDGTIDISDLRIVALHFGEITTLPYPRYDVDANGTVDILDLRQVAGGM